MSKRPPSNTGRYTSMPISVAAAAIFASAIAPFWFVVNMSEHCSPVGRKARCGYPSWSTDSRLPAGSVNQAMGGPSPRMMPRSSCSKPS